MPHLWITLSQRIRPKGEAQGSSVFPEWAESMPHLWNTLSQRIRETPPPSPPPQGGELPGTVSPGGVSHNWWAESLHNLWNHPSFFYRPFFDPDEEHRFLNHRPFSPWAESSFNPWKCLTLLLQSTEHGFRKKKRKKKRRATAISVSSALCDLSLAILDLP
jgi:hypothetical protein